MDREYVPSGRTIVDFHASDAFVRAIRGPIGSGKSSACVAEIIRRAGEQRLGPDGVRRSRWAIIRNSYPELRTTTVKTWCDWIPQEFGRMTFDSPITHRIQTSEMDIEVLFLALDKPDDIKKLLSLELTGAWINEARQIPKDVLDALTGRVGRYPAKNSGGATWSGILLDTNPPDDQHWWYKLAEEETPKNWEFFSQPSGEHPDAENTQNLPADYYERIKAGKDDDWIKVYVRGEYGYVTEGKPVYPMFRDRLHVAETIIEPVPDSALLIAADFGLTPAAVIAQRTVDGRWLIIDEVTTDNTGIIRFAEVLKTYIATTYPNNDVGIAYGDPAGGQRAFSDEQTAFDIMRAHTDWTWRPAPSNDIQIRTEVVKAALNRLIDGNPGFLISPKAKTLRKGFAGGYHYQLSKSGNGAVTSETPRKNEFSHVHDALQYLLLGGGEQSVILNKKRRSGPAKTIMCSDMDYDVFENV